LSETAIQKGGKLRALDRRSSLSPHVQRPGQLLIDWPVHPVQSLMKRLGLPRGYPASSIILMTMMSALTFPYSKHLSAACRAHTLSCRPTIFHSYALSILHLPFSTALHTVCLHLTTSYLYGGYYIYLWTVNSIPKLHEIAICVLQAMSTTWPTIQHDTIRRHHDLACVGRGFPLILDYLQIEVSFTTA